MTSFILPGAGDVCAPGFVTWCGWMPQPVPVGMAWICNGPFFWIKLVSPSEFCPCISISFIMENIMKLDSGNDEMIEYHEMPPFIASNFSIPTMGISQGWHRLLDHKVWFLIY